MKRYLLTAAALLAATPAIAHHPMGGAAPQTMIHGLLSGVGHPVIGIDHLAFVVMVGIASVLAGVGVAGPLAFVAATVAGTLLHLSGVVLPAAELVIAGSVVILGALLVSGRSLPRGQAAAGFALAGLFHGWAYGAAVIGSESGAVLAYLLGFALVQAAIALIAAQATRMALARPSGQMQARLAAAICCGVGVAIMIETVEGLIFA